MDEIHVHKTKKSICAHFAESPCMIVLYSTSPYVINKVPNNFFEANNLYCCRLTVSKL